MILKISGAVLVMAACMFFGNRISAAMKKRADFLNCFRHDIILLKSRIEEREKLTDGFMYVSNFSDYPEFWKSLVKFSASDGMDKCFVSALNGFADDVSLKDSDIKTLSMLGNGLGVTDISAQTEHIDYIAHLTEVQYNTAMHDYENNIKLCRTGSILLGIMTVILLI